MNFDHFDNYEVPDIFLCYPASRYVNGAPTHVVGCIPYCTDIEFVFNFSDISELRFRAVLDSDDTDLHSQVLYSYNMISRRMYIFIRDIGYFRIRDVSEVITESERYKNIEAESCEVELTERDILLFEDNSYIVTELIYGAIRSEGEDVRRVYPGVGYVVPQWGLTPSNIAEDVDPDLLPSELTPEEISAHERYIAYDNSEHNAYDFIIKNIQETYNCVVLFDIIRRRIRIIAQRNYIDEMQTSIHLTRHDVIREITSRDSNDSAVTVLAGYTGDGTSITAVNPTGDSFIYNLRGYIDWIPEIYQESSFRAKVYSWMNALEDKTENGARRRYYSQALNKARAMVDRTNAQAEVDRLKQLRSVYQRCKDNLNSSYGSLSCVDLYNDNIGSSDDYISVVNDSISQTVDAISTKILNITNTLLPAAEASVTAATQIISDADAIMLEIRDGTDALNHEDACAPRSRFSSSEFAILSSYFFYGSYTDSSLTINTESNNPEVERIHILDRLYDNTEYKMYEVSQSVPDFSVSTDSFIFISTFQKWTRELHTGAIINIEIGDGDVEKLHISSMTINYEDQSSSFTFSAAIRNNNARALFRDVFDGVTVKKR